MRRNSFEEIEFRFFKFGGRARGRFAIIILAVLIMLGMVLTAIIWTKASSLGTSFYDHLGGPHSRGGKGT